MYVPSDLFLYAKHIFTYDNFKNNYLQAQANAGENQNFRRIQWNNLSRTT